MTNIQRVRTQAQLTHAGFAPWQVAQFPTWVARLSNPRQWRRLTRRIYGIAPKA